MPRVLAEVALLDAYAQRVAELETSRLAQLENMSDSLRCFFASGSAFGPTSSALPEQLAQLFSETAMDAVGVMATAAAFREVDRLLASDGFGTWAPTDQWLETQRRAWLDEYHPNLARLAAAPITDPVVAARRMAEIDETLAGLAASGTVPMAAVEALMAERQQLVAESVTNLNALTDSIDAWSGSDNDPAFDALVGARRDIVNILVDADVAAARHMEGLLNHGVEAGQALFVTAHQQLYEARIVEVIAIEGVTRARAIDVLAEIDARVLALVEAGHPAEDAMVAVGVARAADLDLDVATAHAGATGLGLVEVLGHMAAARAMDLTLQELAAFDGLREHFATFDNATRDNTDNRVSARDLLYVTEHPSQFTPSQVLGAQGILDSPLLRNRLDTAADNNDLLDGPTFGNTNPGDGIIGLRDIDAFLIGTHLNNLLGDHAASIDVAAHGGDSDGTFSRHDLQAWLSDPANSTVPVDVRDGVQLMLDNGLFDESWLEQHRDDLALGAAVVAGGAVIILTGGTAAPLLLTLGAGVAAGAGAAGLTTVAINGTTGADLHDGVLANSLAGGFIGMSVAGLPATIGCVGTSFTLANAAAISGATAEVTGIVSLGGTDLLIPEDWEHPVHVTTGAISTATGIPALVYAGQRLMLRRIRMRRPAGTPLDWSSRPADNGRGTVWQRPGADRNIDMVRVMDPTSRYPNGYVRFYNDQGQPLTIYGKPGSRPETHLSIERNGTYSTAAGWPS